MKPNDFLQALCVVVIWGFNFVAIKLSVTEIPPITLIVLRFSLTAVILIPLFRITKIQLLQILPVSLVLGVGHFGLLYIGLRGADAATSALLIQLGVPFSSILAAIFFADKLGWKRSIGMGMAFCGAAFLAGEPQGGAIISIIALVVSAFCWAWANILIKKLQGIHPLAVIGWMGLITTPFIAMLSYVMETGQVDAVLSASPIAWMTLAYTIIGSSILAYSLWYSLISRLDVNQVVPFTLLAPMIGVGAGVLILGETLSVYKIIGGLMTIVGVFIIQMRLAKRARK